MTLEKIALVSCRSPYVDDDKVYPPLGILYLKSYVEKHTDVEVDLFDEYDLENPDQFKGYSHVGVSVMTPQRAESLRILNHVKKYTDAKTIIGGPHALHYFFDVQKEDWDYVVSADGQRSLVKILEGDKNRLQIDKMNKEDWANNPRPDRTSKKAVKFLSEYNYTLQDRTSGTMLTATGCPERCAFCEDAQTAVRWSAYDSLAKEMDDLINLGYKGVYLFDDLFAIALPKIKPILADLKKRDLIFRCNGQARYFTKWGDEFAKELSIHGCAEIAFGHETGSQKILDNIIKRTTVEQNYQSIEYAKKYGIYVKSFILLGLPGEDRKTLADTEKFVKNGGMDDFQCVVYYPYKGTKIRDAIDRKDSEWDIEFIGEGLGAYGQKGGNTEAVVRTSALSQEELLEFRDYLVMTYRPRSHKTHWNSEEDKFFDTNLNSDVEYD